MLALATSATRWRKAARGGSLLTSPGAMSVVWSSWKHILLSLTDQEDDQDPAPDRWRDDGELDTQKSGESEGGILHREDGGASESLGTCRRGGGFTARSLGRCGKEGREGAGGLLFRGYRHARRGPYTREG